MAIELKVSYNKSYYEATLVLVLSESHKRLVRNALIPDEIILMGETANYLRWGLSSGDCFVSANLNVTGTNYQDVEGQVSELIGVIKSTIKNIEEILDNIERPDDYILKIRR
ncbi:MAG: hypothetical protein F6J86_26905 [Symploca sp. SIO1B1]|nr:hypothetical protein [Symploca sp. SIO1B1]